MITNLRPTDLNCNVFSCYDYDGLSIQELLCQFFTKINECVAVSNKTFELATWLKETGLNEETVKVVTGLIEDGTIQRLINEGIFKNLENKFNLVQKEVIDARKGENTLKDKIDKMDKTITEIEESGTTADLLEKAVEKSIQKHIKDQSIQAMAIGDGTLEGKKLQNRTVPYYKTDFLVPKDNLFDTSASALSELGYWLNTSNGNPEANQHTRGLKYTKYPIPVTEGEQISINRKGIHSWVYYDETGNFVKGVVPNSEVPSWTTLQVYTFTVPPRAKVVKFSVENAYLTELMCKRGEFTEKMLVTPFELTIPGLDVNGVEEIANGSVKRLNEITEPIIKDPILTVGTFREDREASSTFTGWAIPLKKSDLKGNTKIKSVCVTAGIYEAGVEPASARKKLDNIKCVLELIDPNQTITKQLAFTRSINGKVLFSNFELNLDEVGDDFLLGVRAVEKCNLVFAKGYSTGEYQGSGRTALYSTNYDEKVPSGRYNISSSVDWVDNSDFTIGLDYDYKIAKDKVTIDDVTGLQEALEGTMKGSVQLFTPEIYKAVVGDNLQVFYKGLILSNDPYSYNWEVVCNRGKNFKRMFEYTPERRDIGRIEFNVAVGSDSGKILDKKSVYLDIKDKATSPKKMTNILCVGDSLTNGGTWCAEVDRRLTGTGGQPAGDQLTNIRFVGDRKNGKTGYVGYGGWTYNSYNQKPDVKAQMYWIVVETGMKTTSDQHSVWSDSTGKKWIIETLEPEVSKIKIKRQDPQGTYALPETGELTWVSGGSDHSNIKYSSSKVAEANPFWVDGEVNFKKFADQQLVQGNIDYCYILLGWNQTTSTESLYKESARTFVRNLRKSYPACKVVFMGLQVPSLEGCGNNYSLQNNHWNFYNITKTIFKMNEWTKQLAKEVTNADYIDIAGQFDTDYCYPTSTRKVNNRSAITETFQNNGVHPSTDGYYQIADAVYRDLTHQLQP